MNGIESHDKSKKPLLAKFRKKDEHVELAKKTKKERSPKVSIRKLVACFMISGENMVHKMRKAYFKSLLRQDIGWFEKNSTGTLSSKMFDNLERIREGTGDKVALFVQLTSQFFSGFVIAFIYDWKLTLIMMSLSPLMIVSGVFMARLMSATVRKEAEKYAKAGAIAEEALSSIRTVVAFNGQDYECSRYEKALEAGKLDGIKKSMYIGVGLGFTFFSIFASYALAFWIGTGYVADGYLEPKVVFVVFFSVMFGSMSLGQAGQQLAVISSAQGAASAIFEVIDRRPDIDSSNPTGDKPSDIRGKISYRNVKFAYPSRPDITVLKGINFEAHPGQTVALVGSSGCGKSTIVQLLLRYYDPYEGEIFIDDHKIADLNIEFLRRQIGVVSQEPVLFNFTIEENIKFGNQDVSQAEMIHASRMANADSFIANLPQGYKTIVGERGTQLSGGQKQRIAIARALVRNPKILLLDEATSALDAESEAAVQSALDKAQQGRTTIIIAHRLSTIKNADIILAIKDGEMVETGKHEDLMERQGLYYELVNSQVFTDIEEQTSRPTSPISRQTSVISQHSLPSARNFRHRTISKVSESSEPKAPAQEDPETTKKRYMKELEQEGAQEQTLTQILKYAKPEWMLLLLGVVSCMVQGTVFPAFSLFFTEVLETFAELDKEKMRSEGHFWAVMFLILGLIQAATLFGQAFLFGISAERFTMRLRSKLFRNVMRMDIAYFDMPNHSSGKISTRLATDTPNVRSAIDYRLGGIFAALVSIIAGVIIGLYFGWQLAIVLFIIFPLSIISQALRMRYLRGTVGKDAKNYENAGRLALEAIENVRTVQALTLEKRFYEKFSESLEMPHKRVFKKSIMQAITYGLSSSVIFWVYAVAWKYGVFLVLEGILEPMNVMRVINAINFSLHGIGYAASYFPEYAKARLAAGIIFKMLSEKPKIDSFMAGGKKNDINGLVSFKDLRFSYPERPSVAVLKGLDLEVEPGKTLALVGPSGCGKSTVVSLLERFYDPEIGQVVIDSDDLREFNIRHIRSHISLVAQEPVLFDCSIRENIVYGLDSSKIPFDAIEHVCKLANIDRFINDLPEGYDTRVGEKGTQLSGGQKQRIAIARALIRNPKILLLDEATSALDAESEKVVQEALDRASEGRTCIVIAHRLSTIVNADCIAVIKDGMVIEKGTHVELLAKRGVYYQLTQKQNSGARN